MNAFLGANGMDILKQSFHCMVMLYASLLYHFSYLTTKIHKKSPLFACFIFTNAPLVLKSNVRVSYPWDKDINTPVLTGIPPHILVLSQLDSPTRSQLKIADEVMERMKNELDNRDIGGGYHASKLVEEMSKAHNDIIKKITEVKTIALSASNDASMSLVTGGCDENSWKLNDQKRSGLHYHSGKFHRLPQGWVFPRMSFQPFLVMWLVGNTNSGVPPLKTLAAADVAFMGKRSRKTLSEMRGLAQAVEKAGKITGA